MTKPAVNLARRKFVLAAGCAGVAGAAAVMIGRPPAPPATPATTDQAGSSGYRETTHIRKYYRTARLF
jgi:hypothetical protein